jgi:hypothetical protein
MSTIETILTDTLRVGVGAACRRKKLRSGDIWLLLNKVRLLRLCAIRSGFNHFELVKLRHLLCLQIAQSLYVSVVDYRQRSPYITASYRGSNT